MPDGRLIVDAYFTRAGVFRYADAKYPGGWRHELRLPEEVFARPSMDSFAMLPFVNGHPSVGLLDANIARDYMVGATGEKVERDGDFMRGSIMVADRDTADQMESGKVQLSNGYTCDFDPTPGSHPIWGRYDGIQRNIRGNHVALVDAGRAGSACAARMDSVGEVGMYCEPDQGAADQGLQPPVRRANTLNMDPQQALPALEKEIADLKKANAELETKAQSETKRADAAEAERDHFKKRADEAQAARADEKSVLEAEAVKAATKRVDELQKELDGYNAKFDGAVRARASLQATALVVLGAEKAAEVQAMTERQIHAEMIRKLDSSEDVSEKRSDSALEALASRLYREHVEGARAFARAGAALSARGDETPKAAPVAKPAEPWHGRGVGPLPSEKYRTK